MPTLTETLIARVTAWMEADVDPAAQTELQNLLTQVQADSPAAQVALHELTDRFAAELEFGTAGLRGAMAAGPNRMNRAVVIRAAAGLSQYLTHTLGPHGPARVVVGFDARHHSGEFAQDTAAVLTAAGHEVLLMPQTYPTPVLAFAVRSLHADAGVMVTASHNPPQDNGYKVYLGGRVVSDWGDGAQIVPPFDALIAEQIHAAPGARDVPRAATGWTTLDPQIEADYIASVLAHRDDAPRTVKLVTTALHGVGGQTLAKVLTSAGFTDVTPVAEQQQPDPAFPTVSFPNPEEPGAIDLALQYAEQFEADLVIANDPDADRCAVAINDPRHGGWRMLHGDEVGALLGDDIASRQATNPVTGATLACSIVSSSLLSKIAHHHGCHFTPTLTGFKWISRAPGLIFGYEEALGYCVAPAAVRDKDGISAALLIAQLANRLKADGRTLLDALDDLARRHGVHLTDQVSARYTDLRRIGEIMSRIRATPPASLAGSAVVEVTDLAEGSDHLPPTDGLRLATADGTRVIVRPSGTEPKVKCYLEVIQPVAPTASFAELSSARTEARTQITAISEELRRVLGL